jgi:hypothetical protein
MVTTVLKYGALATATHYLGMTIAKPIGKAYGYEIGMPSCVEKLSAATLGRIRSAIDYYGRNQDIERLILKLKTATDSDCFEKTLNDAARESDVIDDLQFKIKDLAVKNLGLKKKAHGSLEAGQKIENMEKLENRLKNMSITRGIGRWITSTVQEGFETVFWTMPDALADKAEHLVKNLYSRVRGNKGSNFGEKFRQLNDDKY